MAQRQTPAVSNPARPRCPRHLHSNAAAYHCDWQQRLHRGSVGLAARQPAACAAPHRAGAGSGAAQRQFVCDGNNSVSAPLAAGEGHSTL
jgi:hypothetical protein